MKLIRRLKNLWILSGIDFHTKKERTYVNQAFTADGIKERLGVKRMAIVVQDPLEVFDNKDELS